MGLNIQILSKDIIEQVCINFIIARWTINTVDPLCYTTEADNGAPRDSGSLSHQENSTMHTGQLPLSYLLKGMLSLLCQFLVWMTCAVSLRCRWFCTPDD